MRAIRQEDGYQLEFQCVLDHATRPDKDGHRTDQQMTKTGGTLYSVILNPKVSSNREETHGAGAIKFNGRENARPSDQYIGAFDSTREETPASYRLRLS